MSSAVQGMQQMGPITGPNGEPTREFRYWMLSVWQRSGSGYAPVANAVYIVNETGGLEAFDVNGNSLGFLQNGSQPGDPAQVQALGASPFVFVASIGGTLVSSSGKLEISRDGGVTFYRVGLVGGAVPVLKNDQVRVSWLAGAPAVVFLPVKS